MKKKINLSPLFFLYSSLFFILYSSEQYIKNLKKMGLDPDKKVSEQIDKLAEAIKKVEDWKEGTIKKKTQCGK